MKDGVEDNGTVIDSIDSLSPRVSVSGQVLTFFLGNGTSLEENATYYVLMDLGVVVGSQTCKGKETGVPYLGMYDKSVWNFTTGIIKNSHYIL